MCSLQEANRDTQRGWGTSGQLDTTRPERSFMEFSVVPPGSGRDYDWSNDHIYVTTPYEITDGRITVGQDVLAPGFHLARHHHRAMTEVFVVTEGEVTFAFDSQTFLAVQGTAVTVPPGVWHEVTCAAGARMAMVFTPGGFDHYLAQVAGSIPRSCPTKCS
jgi:quercetin dioxygenase-like cupin family protein